MRIEIDQSPRIEETNRSGVVAFSNGFSRAVFISAKTKRRVFELLKLQGRLSDVAKVMFFSAMVFLLIQNYLDKISEIIIDLEYPGHEADIKLRLLYLTEKFKKKLKLERINFKSIGKSKAHWLAWKVYKGRIEPDMVLGVNDLIRCL